MSITPDEFLPQPPPGEDWVPSYTEHEGSNSLLGWADSIRDQANFQLPITQHPDYRPYNPDEHHHYFPFREASQRAICEAQIQIINAFYSAITTKKTEVIVAMVQNGLVSPDVLDASGSTPLLAAVDAGNATAVRTLIDLGAVVDGYGSVKGGFDRLRGVQRTALQRAAGNGNLVLVKLLMEECGANDALVAPDGQTALRLAADNNNREVVDYLPLRRGGEWRRWKTHHAKAMERVQKALWGIYYFGKALFWYLPKGVFYWLPKHLVVIPVRDATNWAWKNKQRFGGWCKRQFVEFPRRAKKLAKETWEGIKAIPDGVREILKALWRVMKSVPPALKIAGLWVWDSLRRMGSAVASALGRVVSFLHTIFAAIVDFFRTITLKDVWNGLVSVLRAIFVGLPKAVFAAVEAFGEMTYKALGALFGGLGKALWWIAKGLIKCVTYLPQQIWEIISRMGSSVGKAFHETRVWINPKA